jgi:hypothetical protein
VVGYLPSPARGPWVRVMSRLDIVAFAKKSRTRISCAELCGGRFNASSTIRVHGPPYGSSLKYPRSPQEGAGDPSRVVFCFAPLRFLKRDADLR